MMISMRWQRRMKFWGLVVLLGILGGFASFAIIRFIDAFYTNIPLGYEPKDSAREKALEQKPAGGTDR